MLIRKAKDTLWELELYQILRAHSIKASLGEPDIVANYSGAQVGIACKKFYSESNVSKVLSNAVGQIEKTFELGIIAINLDDLLPADSIIKVKTLEQMSGALVQRNDDFLRAHERHLRRYLTPGRALSALISCSAFAIVTESQRPLMNARQSTVWHIPGLPMEKEQRMNQFVALIGSQYAA